MRGCMNDYRARANMAIVRMNRRRLCRMRARLAPSLSRFLLSRDDETPERPLFRRVAEADGETARETCITLHLINIHSHRNSEKQYTI